MSTLLAPPQAPAAPAGEAPPHAAPPASGGSGRRSGSTAVKVVAWVVAGWLLLAPLVTIAALVVAGFGLVALARQQVNCSVAGTGTQVSGVTLDAEQLANAQLIATTAAGLGLPQRAAQIAVATALQESSLRNVDHGDAAGPDSLGLFQQRAPYGPNRADPVTATRMFLARLTAVPGWQSLPLTVAAADVQRPRADLAGAYAQWEPLAGQLVTRYWPATTGSAASAASATSVAASAAGSTTGPSGTTAATAAGTLLAPGQADPQAPSALSVLRGTACLGTGGEGLGEQNGATGGQALPPGWTPAGSASASTAIAWALAQRGKPYIWGGVGPDGFDCSGLVMRAWAAAGVALPRTTVGQRTAGVAVASLDQLQPGDLLFIAGSDGTAAAPGHVGMFIGTVDGVPSFVQAPRTGDVVQVDPLTRWNGLIVAIRRPVIP